MVHKFDTPRGDEFVDLLCERLPNKTFQHVVSVAKFMLTFYKEAGITREQAVNAGLLHDVCKAMSKEALTELAANYGITDYLDEPNLLHGPVGAEECRVNLHITDEEVLDAIRYHTTGRGDWNRVGCALYLADFAETRRTHEEAPEARRILKENGFITALKYVVDTKTRHVRERYTLDKNSEAFLEWVAREFSS